MLRFEPFYKDVLWGGRKLASAFGRKIPDGSIGESWELVEWEHFSNLLQGSFTEKLGAIWRSGRLGGSAKGRFPFLLKWIDANAKMSVQVHPDEYSCKKMSKGEPKSEAWLIAEASEEAKLWLGHTQDLNAENFINLSKNGKIAHFLKEYHPKAGNIFNVPAGALHCIGGGSLLLEVQQPSDTTYRVWDWNRKDENGQSRPLHVQEALHSVAFERSIDGPVYDHVEGPNFYAEKMSLKIRIPSEMLRVCVAQKPLGAKLMLDSGAEITLNYGDVVVAEREDGDIQLLEGDAILLGEHAP